MPSQPNILWICTDQQRWDTIHALGNEQIHTPNLDRLCAEGVAFTRAHCQNPICSPSRASFLTGLYPSRLPANINGNAQLNLPEGVELITRRLADAGYECGLSGKLHLASAFHGVENRVDDGYSYFAYSHAPTQGMGMGNQYTDWLESMGKLDDVLDLSGFDPDLQRGAAYRPNVPFELHHTTWCCDRAIEFMRDAGPGPWLMSVNIFDPHPPYDAPEDYATRYDPDDLDTPRFEEGDLENQGRIAATHMFQSGAQTPGKAEQRNKANYYGMIELLDENVGRMLDELEESGQREKTLVIFTSDHGNLLGDHGLSQKGCRFYDGLVRVPLLMSWADHFDEGVRADGLVELTDLAPTLAELAGSDMHPTDGETLVPILKGESDPGVHRKRVRCEFYDVLDMDYGKADRAPHDPSYATMLRDERYKLVDYHGSEYGELYDMERDPEEHDNLWEDPEMAEIRRRMIRQITEIAPVTEDPAKRVGRF